MPNHTDITDLLADYLANPHPELEKKLLQLSRQENREVELRQALAALMQQAAEDTASIQLDTAHYDALFSNFISADVPTALEKTQTPVAHRVHFLRTAWFRYAAAVVLILGAGAYLWNNLKTKGGQETKAMVKQIAPGGEKATLTLGDGTVIVLDSAANGQLAMETGRSIIKKNGEVIYGQLPSTHNEAVTYNTMSTPRGGQYKLTLPDGTKVWLNAASSITYPVVFSGGERSVQVSGELYFEVTKNERMPFKVKINPATEVQVLGTHFNVNAYTDEQYIKTTLLEGAVKVNLDQKVQLLQPGQQAKVNRKESSIQWVERANTEQAIAWKTGLFYFEDADIKEVMRELSRWYNVEVTYEGTIPARAFNGKIGKSLTLDQVLKGLAKTRVNYRIENGNRIIVMP